MGHEIVFPGAGYIAMAIEAIFQVNQANVADQDSKSVDEFSYRLRDVVFSKALVLEEDGKGHTIMLTLTPRTRSKDSWHEFRVSSLVEGLWSEHCHGLVRLATVVERGTFTNTLRSAPKLGADIMIRPAQACHGSTNPHNAWSDVVQGNARCRLQFRVPFSKAVGSGVYLWHATESSSRLIG